MTESNSILKTITLLLTLFFVWEQSFIVAPKGAKQTLPIVKNMSAQSAHHLDSQSLLTPKVLLKTALLGGELSLQHAEFCADTDQQCDNCHQCHGTHLSLLTMAYETLFVPAQLLPCSVNNSYLTKKYNDIYRPPLV